MANTDRREFPGVVPGSWLEQALIDNRAELASWPAWLRIACNSDRACRPETLPTTDLDRAKLARERDEWQRAALSAGQYREQERTRAEQAEARATAADALVAALRALSAPALPGADRRCHCEAHALGAEGVKKDRVTGHGIPWWTVHTASWCGMLPSLTADEFARADGFLVPPAPVPPSSPTTTKEE